MTPTNLQRIEDALKVLQEEGLTHIKPEYQKDYPRFQAVGLAIASVTDSARTCLTLPIQLWNIITTFAPSLSGLIRFTIEHSMSARTLAGSRR